MAFTVAPSSGSSPYVFTAVFDNKENIGAEYTISFRTSQETGVCPSFGTFVNNIATNSILATGTWTGAGNVAAGSCYVATLFLLHNGIVVEQLNATINNL